MEELKENIFFEDLLLKNFIKLNPEENEVVKVLRNNEQVRKWCYHENIISAGEHSKFIENLKQDLTKFYWLVKRKDEFLGVISLNRVDFENRSAYLGIYSNTAIGKTGSILMDCLKMVAFGVAKLHTLKLEVIEDNERALKLYIRSGFKKEGQLIDYVFKNGAYKNVILMGIISDDEITN